MFIIFSYLFFISVVMFGGCLVTPVLLDLCTPSLSIVFFVLFPYTAILFELEWALCNFLWDACDKTGILLIAKYRFPMFY